MNKKTIVFVAICVVGFIVSSASAYLWQKTITSEATLTANSTDPAAKVEFINESGDPISSVTIGQIREYDSI